jgi:hypothetical protein
MRLKLAPTLAPVVVTIPLSFNLYAVWWAVNYRLPPESAAETIDLRKDAKTQSLQRIASPSSPGLPPTRMDSQVMPSLSGGGHLIGRGLVPRRSVSCHGIRLRRYTEMCPV